MIFICSPINNMLSRPDFLQKQIIFIGAEQIKTLKILNSTLQIKEHNETLSKVSLSKMFCLFVVWDCTITTQVFRKLSEFGVIVYLVSKSLRPIVMLGNNLQWNYLLRANQYALDDESAINLSKQLIQNKIQNQYDALSNIRTFWPKEKQLLLRIKENIQSCMLYTMPDAIRWVEWGAAKHYFSLMFWQVWRHRRAPRTKEDMLNFLLDMWYWFLYGFFESLLSMYGFDIYKWFFHTLFYERKSLLCDVIEPRRCIIDLCIRKNINLKVFSYSDFFQEQNAYVLKKWKYIKYSEVFLKEILRHKAVMYEYVRELYRVVLTQKKTLPLYSYKNNIIECWL